MCTGCKSPSQLRRARVAAAHSGQVTVDRCALCRTVERAAHRPMPLQTAGVCDVQGSAGHPCHTPTAASMDLRFVRPLGRSAAPLRCVAWAGVMIFLSRAPPWGFRSMGGGPPPPRHRRRCRIAGIVRRHMYTVIHSAADFQTNSGTCRLRQRLLRLLKLLAKA
jgi:hypothetical protein